MNMNVPTSNLWIQYLSASGGAGMTGRHFLAPPLAGYKASGGLRKVVGLTNAKTDKVPHTSPNQTIIVCNW